MATTNNVLDAVLAQYENSKQGGSSNTSKMSSDERMKKYFAAILKDSEKQGQKRLRILPTPDGSSPLKRYGSTRLKLMENGLNFMIQVKTTMSVHH